MVLDNDNAAGFDYDAVEMLMQTTDVDVDRELAARSFRDYVDLAWPQVEPAVPFQPNWHVDAICDHLEAVKAGEIDRLVINVPPGVGKSLLACVFFPSWLWSDWPGAKVISASYSEDFAKRDSLRTRNLLESPFWRERWGHQMHANRSQWAAGHFRNKQGGFRLAAGVASGVTGEHANIQIVDDPLKPIEVTGSLHISKTALERCTNWWDQTMATRLVDATTGISARVIIMQRLHEGDLAGLMLKDAGYHHLCLPMEYRPDAQPCPVKGCAAKHKPNVDPRTEDGELLVPERKSRDEVERLKVELGARGAAAQLGQVPSPPEGATFKRATFRFYKRDDLPRLTKQIQSWDLTFKESGTSFVVGQAWGQAGASCYLLAERRDRWGLTDTCKQIEAMSLDFPKAYAKYIEAKANGDAVVDALKDKLTGLVLVEPEGGKMSRANAVEPMFEAGNVWFPDPSEAPWVDAFIEELLAFPAGINDDRVDALTQALIKLRSAGLAKLRAAMGSKAAGRLRRM